MTRIVKKPHERRKELIEAAWELFQINGYAATTVEAIIRKTGIAKGTFYYYYQSKEDILAAVVHSLLERVVEEARTVSSNPAMSALEKLRFLLGGQSPSVSDAQNIAESLHHTENRELHEKINVETILKLSPIIAEVVEQGIGEGVFHADNVLETIQFLLSGSQFLFEQGLFSWSVEELMIRQKAMEAIIERSLGAERGTFSFLTERL